jgi:hypothetical protein
MPFYMNQRPPEKQSTQRTTEAEGRTRAGGTGDAEGAVPRSPAPLVRPLSLVSNSRALVVHDHVPLTAGRHEQVQDKTRRPSCALLVLMYSGGSWRLSFRAASVSDIRQADSLRQGHE